MRVLLVDDEKDLVETLAERLSMRGIDAHWATGADDATLLMQEHEFDLAVLDIKMPGTGGLELKRRFAAMRPSLKFIFLTGHGSEDDYRVGAAEVPDKYYLVKPVKLEELISKMNEVLGGKKQENDSSI